MNVCVAVRSNMMKNSNDLCKQQFFNAPGRSLVQIQCRRCSY
jgi:hypothetical protein